MPIEGNCLLILGIDQKSKGCGISLHHTTGGICQHHGLPDRALETFYLPAKWDSGAAVWFLRGKVNYRYAR